MKKTAVIFLLQLTFFTGMGKTHKTDKTGYVQKLEYRLKGPVKEVNTYISNVTGNTIPTDTAHYKGKITMTFDRSGNVLAQNKTWDLGSVGKAQFLSNFSGKGRDVSLQETSRINEEAPETINHEYVWSDDYNYTIIGREDPTYSIAVTLDNHYQLIKTVSKKNGTTQYTEEWTPVYKADKMLELESKTVENRDGKKIVTYQIQVVQQYDEYGNPTLIYCYNDRSKQKVEQVLLKQYKYYQE